MNTNYKKYKKILRKCHHPLSSEEEFLRAINNTKKVADVIYSFKKRSSKNKKNKKYV